MKAEKPIKHKRQDILLQRGIKNDIFGNSPLRFEIFGPTYAIFFGVIDYAEKDVSDSYF